MDLTFEEIKAEVKAGALQRAKEIKFGEILGRKLGIMLEEAIAEGVAEGIAFQIVEDRKDKNASDNVH